MTSPLPPKRRNTRDAYDLIRQDRVRLGQLDRGLVGGRAPMLRPLKPSFTDADEDDFDDTTILFENRDWTTASGPGSVTFKLSHEPLDGSLHIRWNGLDQPPTEWTVEGNTVTIPDPTSLIRSGDVFTAAYAYEDAEGEPPAPLLIGSTIAQGVITSIAMPDGVQAGDLLILVCASFGTVTTTDSRIVGTHQAFGPGELVAWGYADGSGTPVAVHPDGGLYGYASTALVVYRNVRVTGTLATNTTTGSTLTAATIANAQAALVALLAWTGTVSGFLNGDSTGAWTTDAWEGHIKTNVRVCSWVSGDVTTTPPGSFLLTGDNSGFGAVTLLLEAAA